MVAANISTGRKLLADNHGGHSHDSHHHHQHHHTGLGRKMLTEDLPLAVPGEGAMRASNQRTLLQLVQANLDDPTSYPANAAGLPLLHSRPGATRKIYLDFDGHTAM
jgi:hypothetical protein